MVAETERSGKWVVIVPVVLAVLTAMAYVMGALALQSRRRSLGIDLLSGPADADYLYTGGQTLLLLFFLAISGFFVGKSGVRFYRKFVELPASSTGRVFLGRSRPRCRANKRYSERAIALAVVFMIIEMYIAETTGWVKVTTGVFTVVLFGIVAFSAMKHWITPRPDGVLITCTVVVLLQCAIVASKVPWIPRAAETFPVITFSTSDSRLRERRVSRSRC